MKQLCLSARVSDSQDDKQVINVLTRTDVKNTKKKSEGIITSEYAYILRLSADCVFLSGSFVPTFNFMQTHTHTHARARARATHITEKKSSTEKQWK